MPAEDSDGVRKVTKILADSMRTPIRLPSRGLSEITAINSFAKYSKLTLLCVALGSISFECICAEAESTKSPEDAARDFVAYFSQTAPYVARYEMGASGVSDNYPSAIAQGLVPKGTTLYPVRIHWCWGGRNGIFRSDFFLFQDSFGSWKDFYIRDPSMRNSGGPLWAVTARQQAAS